jgi:hypothetical protein
VALIPLDLPALSMIAPTGTFKCCRSCGWRRTSFVRLQANGFMPHSWFSGFSRLICVHPANPPPRRFRCKRASNVGRSMCRRAKSAPRRPPRCAEQDFQAKAPNSLSGSNSAVDLSPSRYTS